MSGTARHVGVCRPDDQGGGQSTGHLPNATITNHQPRHGMLPQRFGEAPVRTARPGRPDRAARALPRAPGSGEWGGGRGGNLTGTSLHLAAGRLLIELEHPGHDQHPLDGFQCHHPSVVARWAATATFARGSKMSAPPQPAADDRADQ